MDRCISTFQDWLIKVLIPELKENLMNIAQLTERLLPFSSSLSVVMEEVNRFYVNLLF